MNEIADIAQALAAMGHEHRLQVFRLLVRAGHRGMSVGSLGGKLGLPASTLAHHLSTLVDAGLVVQERCGRSVINRAEFDRMHMTLDYLTTQCCADAAETEAEN